jgi:hypothetical protein
MKTKQPAFNLVRPSGMGPKVNQHAPVYAHKATKRNRSRAAKNRKAIIESKDS